MFNSVGPLKTSAMSDSHTTDSTEASEAASSNSSTTGLKRPRWHRFADYFVFGLAAVFLVSQYFIWNVWEPSLGDSLKNLITQSQFLLIQVLFVLWVFLCSPMSRKTALIIGIPLAVLVIGRFAAIRRIEFTGDMVPTFVWRWEKTQDDVLDEYLINAESTSLASDAEEIVITPEDSPGYRGADRSGVVIGPPIVQELSGSPEELWRHPVGGGYAGMAVVDTLLITLEQRKSEEVVVCYDTESGREIWNHSYQAHFQEAMGGPGPRTTPTIHGEHVFTMGAFGDVFCLNVIDGTPVWHVNCLQQFGLPNNTWAMSSSPLIVGEHVIINVGGLEGNGLVAYQIADGSIAWQTDGLPEPVKQKDFDTGSAAVAESDKKSVPGYASPFLATIHGVEQIINLDGVAVHGHDPATGDVLWSHPFKNGPNVNVAQPLIFDDGRVFLSASYDVGCMMIQVSKTEAGDWATEELWSNLFLRCKFTTPLLIDGYIYGLDEGRMVCIDPKTGKREWKGARSGLRGKYGHGQLLLVDGQILAIAESGEVVLANVTSKGLEEVWQFVALPEAKTWNPHTLVRGRVYVRNAKEMAAFDLNASEAPRQEELSQN